MAILTFTMTLVMALFRHPLIYINIYEATGDYHLSCKCHVSYRDMSESGLVLCPPFVDISRNVVLRNSYFLRNVLKCQAYIPKYDHAKDIVFYIHNRGTTKILPAKPEFHFGNDGGIQTATKCHANIDTTPCL